MAFIKALKSTKAKINCLVGLINILICSIPLVNTCILFNSFVRLLRDLEFYVFLIFVLINSNFYFIKFI